MDPALLRRWGTLFILLGLVVVGVSIYVSYFFSLTGLTEIMPGLITTYLGVHLINVANKHVPKYLQASELDSGRASPFYFELDPCLVNHRDLPPIPKDIGREYDPVVVDRV